MNPPNSRVSRAVTLRAALFISVMSLIAVTAATAQIAIVGDTGIDASGDYQQELAWCQANTEGDARVTCLKNSAAAQAEKRRGTLDNNGGNFNANAMQRCHVFTGEERAACVARVAGLGSATGSVQGGGVIREVETVVLPEGRNPVVIQPQTANPVLLVPVAPR